MSEDKDVICPRCKSKVDGGQRMALSRSDNRTKVCSSCGMKEALWIFEDPERPLPPLSEPIPSLS